MNKKYYDFITALRYNDKLFDIEDTIKWDKCNLYLFVNSTFTNICLGDSVPILMLLWAITSKKEKNKIESKI